MIDIRRFNLPRDLNDVFNALADALNLNLSGKASANKDYATDVLPVVLSVHAIGDFIPKKTKAESGVIGAKYVVQGWDCVYLGATPTWVERRTLTGN